MGVLGGAWVYVGIGPEFRTLTASLLVAAIIVSMASMSCDDASNFVLDVPIYAVFKLDAIKSRFGGARAVSPWMDGLMGSVVVVCLRTLSVACNITLSTLWTAVGAGDRVVALECRMSKVLIKTSVIASPIESLMSESAAGWAPLGGGGECCSMVDVVLSGSRVAGS